MHSHVTKNNLTSSIQKALHYLNNNYLDNNVSNREALILPLPSTRKLSKSARVSHTTIWKTLCILVQEGKIVKIKNKLYRKDVLPNHALNGTQFEKALQYLQESISRGTWETDTPLPSIRRLAVSAGVSFSSMRKALHALISARKLQAEGRRYFLVNGRFSFSNYITKKTSKWELLRTRIEQDIIYGKFTYGERLPTIKEFQLLYGGCFVTIRKALNALIKKGVLIPYKKSLRLPQLSNSPFCSTVVLIAAGDSLNSINLFFHRPVLREYRHSPTGEIINALEKYCSNSNIKLFTIGYVISDPASVSKIINILKTRTTDIGYILLAGEWFNLEEMEEARTGFYQLLYELSLFNKPIAVFDELGEMEYPKSNFTIRNIQIFTSSSNAAAATIGRLLLKHGHRSIAYISTKHRHIWSRRRLQGLQQVFSDVNCKVEPFVKSQLYSAYDLALASLDISSVDFTGIFSAANSDIFDIKRIESIKNKKLLDDTLSTHAPQFKKIIKLLPSIIKLKPDATFFEKIKELALDFIAHQAHQLYLSPLFKEAIKYSDITAWVCSDDVTALAAMEFLKQHGKTIPEDISVVGFDDVIEAFEARLTSYNFNFSSLAHMLLTYIVKPSLYTFKKPRVIEIEGVLKERESTGKAKEESQL